MNPKLRTALAAAALVLTTSSSAWAQSGECSTDTDCPDGFTCETVMYEACPGCADGESCPPCETGSSSYCTPPPPQSCDENNPCDADDVCVTYTFESCSGMTGPGCAPGEDCPEPDPADEPTCDSSTESYCVPPYLAPCSADADCGSGFTCEDVEICECSAGGSTGSTGSGEEPPPPGDEEPSCSCSPTGDKYCQLVEVACDTDADCSGDLTCQEMYGGDAPTIACVEGEPCPEPDPVAPESYCAPADYAYYGGSVDGGSYGATVAEATGRDEASVTKSEREEFFPVDGSSEGGDKGEVGGCSTTGAGQSGSLLLMFLGLFLIRRRH